MSTSPLFDSPICLVSDVVWNYLSFSSLFPPLHDVGTRLTHLEKDVVPG